MFLGRKYVKSPDTRKSLRFRAGYLIKYARFPRLEDEGDRQLTNLINISEGGLMFVSYELLPVSATLKIWFQFPGKQDPIETFAKVVSVMRVKREAIFLISLRFLDLNAVDRTHIRAFIQDASRRDDSRKFVDETAAGKVKRRRRGAGGKSPGREPPPSLAAG